MITAMILAGGSGSRAQADRPKQFVEVLGKPVLAYTIERFQAHREVDAIEVVCHPAWRDFLAEMLEKYRLTKVKWVANGGETFQKSVIHGLEPLRSALRGEDYVLIQYGAAPFTSAKIISDVIRVMKEKQCAVTATPCYQLMGSNDGNGESKSWVDRDRYIQLACPAGYRFDYLLGLYQRAEERQILETAEPHTTSLVYALGDTLYQAYGDQTNIKITTKEDLFLFEGYVRACQARDKAQEETTL
jgi:2-C-methyl-D-erythritol 4-phosphate cytidylyltransferase